MEKNRTIAGGIALYFAYSIIAGIFIAPFARARGSAASVLLSLMAGPTFGFTHQHGIEVWIMATPVCLFCLLGFLFARQLVLKAVLALALASVWGGLGLWMFQ